MFLEISCLDCSIIYELGTDRELDLNGLICVDCASPRVKIIANDSEISSRVQNLVLAVQELVIRVENIEGSLVEVDTAPAERKKSKKLVN